MIRNVLRGLSLVLLAVLVPACGSSGRSGKIKVAVVTNTTDPFWDICQAGALKGGQDFDVEVIFKQPPSMTVDHQMKVVDDVTKLGIKGLAVSVINPKEQTPRLKAIAQDLPLNNFITMDNDADQTGRLCYVGVDNFEAGKEVGRMARRAHPQGGTLALFVGNTDSSNAVARVAGVLSELAGKDMRADVAAGKYEAKYGDFVLHRQQPITDGGSQDKALANAGDTIEQLKGTPNTCFVGLYAYNPAKILDAANTKGVTGQIKIVGFDEDLATLAGIDQGKIEGSVSQDPYSYGYESVKMLAKVARGEKIPTEVNEKGYYKHTIVSKDGSVPPNSSPGVKARKAADYTKVISDAYAAAKGK